jgi:hypothetical protein
MSWSAVLNVALGLVLAYLVFSVAASRINEFVATHLQWRSKNLENALHTLLGGDRVPSDSAGQAADREPVDPTASPTASPTAVLSANAVRNHPAIAALDSLAGKKRGISYLPARTFSAAVLDVLAPSAVTILDAVADAAVPEASRHAYDELREHPDQVHLDAFERSLPVDSPLRTDPVPRLREAIATDVLERVRVAVRTLPVSHPARRTLLRMLTDSNQDRDKFRAKLEHWYDDAMDRLSGWYKRRVQRWLLGYGAALAVLFNVDTVNIAQTLWRSPVEQSAAALAAGTAAGQSLDKLDTSISALNGLALPVGWTPAHTGSPRAGHPGSNISVDPRHWPATFGQFVVKLIGLVLTAVALGFGAPFWFDVLGKIARLRNTGDKPPRTAATR